MHVINLMAMEMDIFIGLTAVIHLIDVMVMVMEVMDIVIGPRQ